MDLESDESRKVLYEAEQLSVRGGAAAPPRGGPILPAAGVPGPTAAKINGHPTTVSPSPGVADGRPVKIETANAGDHKPIYALLRAVHQAPSWEDFATWLDEPSYEPSDRWLARQRAQIVAHVQVLRRQAWFQGVKLPIGAVQDLAVLPEYGQLGYDRRLLAAAEQSMREDHAVVALAAPDHPEAFQSAGWCEAGARGHTRVSVSDLLAHLSAQGGGVSRRTREARVRRWRHVELDGVRAVYRVAASRQWGTIRRPEHYWQWLISRNAHSDIIVAVAGRDAWEDLGKQSRIIGYAITHGPQVLELYCLPEFGWAAPRLLERACQDAIERDFHTLSLHLPADDRLHELAIMAGGQWHVEERAGGGGLMMKLLDAPQWVEAMYPVLRQRAHEAKLPRPVEIGFETGEGRCRLLVTRRSSRLLTSDGPADIGCDPEALASLLVGNLHVKRAEGEGRLRAIGDPGAMAVLGTLFPLSQFWQSPFDWLRF